MLIALSDNLMVNTNDIIKATLNQNGKNGWLFIRGENKATHLEPDEYRSLMFYIKNRNTPKRIHSESSNDLKIDYSKPHKFEAIMDNKDFCTCGFKINNDIHI